MKEDADSEKNPHATKQGDDIYNTAFDCKNRQNFKNNYGKHKQNLL